MNERMSRRKSLALLLGASLLPALPTSAQPKDDNFLIFFDSNQSALTELTMKLVDTIAKVIPENARVNLTGHCDNSEPNPEKLGFARANAVLTHFLRNPRMARVRFNVMNESTSRPIVKTPPNTKEPRNRRVEVVLVRG